MQPIRCSARTALLALPILAAAWSPSAVHADPKMETRSTRMMSDAKDAQMLIQTLSEEKTEIAALAAQQAQFRKMGGSENNRIARMWGVWIRQHKAGAPMLMKLIKQNGGDPMQAKILKAPPLGDKVKMLAATHADHQAAVVSSQLRFAATNDMMIKRAMSKRATLARKHLKQMAPVHHKAMKMDAMPM